MSWHAWMVASCPNVASKGSFLVVSLSAWHMHARFSSQISTSTFFILSSGWRAYLVVCHLQTWYCLWLHQTLLIFGISSLSSLQCDSKIASILGWYTQHQHYLLTSTAHILFAQSGFSCSGLFQITGCSASVTAKIDTNF